MCVCFLNVCECGYVVVSICINSYCLLGDYVYDRILCLRFCLLKCMVNVVSVKLFVQRSEFNLC